MTTDRPTTLAVPSLQARRSLRAEIADLLVAALMAGELKPEVVYSSRALAEQFGVSATPVREALLDLVKEGLLEVVSNKGFRVVRLTEQELDDITEVRALLEAPTVRRLAERGVDQAAVEALRPLAAAIEDAAKRGDLIAHVHADLAFHLGLLGLAGNPRLVDIVRSLRQSSRLYGLRDAADGTAAFAAFHEHAELLDRVLAGDADGAEALMGRHIRHVREEWAHESLAARP